MLLNLSIRNVVLIEKLDIDFAKGLSVLTGETGAGKSILLDSLGLALGARGDTSLIRAGQEKLSVTAQFSLPENKNHPLFALLEEHEIDFDDILIIKRSINSLGQNKIFVNDQPISVKLLKEIGKNLVEIHGQFDNHGLLNSATHIHVLDAFAELNDLRKIVKTAFDEYKTAKINVKKEEELFLQAKTEEDNLRIWAEELEKIKPLKGEENELNQKRIELANAGKIIENLNNAFQNLCVNYDVTDAVRKAQTAIDRINVLTQNKYENLQQTLENALINTSEAINQIEQAQADINLEDDDINAIEERFFALKDLARKHRTSIDDLPDLLDDFNHKLQAIDSNQEKIFELKQIEEAAKLKYVECARNLSKERKNAAKKLDEKVSAELIPLKMEKAKFVTFVEEKPENLWDEYGLDDISFTVSTNIGTPQGPINKIASGGELARFMLALKVVLANSSSVETMIFDEIDTGIGGATSQAVGQRLAKLGENFQVLVVTHSPQVASNATNHFKVEKNTQDNTTLTNIRLLDMQNRKEEIARMLSGQNITDEARAAANVLLSA